MSKTCLNISLEQDLIDFVKGYVQDNRTTVADVFTQFLVSLKRRVQGDNIDNLSSDSDFYKALVDVQTKLRDGTGQWHTFEEVFGNENKI